MNTYLKNVGLKERQTISLPGAPTCLGIRITLSDKSELKQADIEPMIFRTESQLHISRPPDLQRYYLCQFSYPIRLLRLYVKLLA
jgi:hypothetical protein